MAGNRDRDTPRMTVVALALAGSLGAVLRFALDSVARARTNSDFPFGTIAINVSGSLLLGLIAGVVLFHGAPNALQRIAGTGFCGGYTTFSTASFETVRLFQVGKTRAALTNALGTITLCLLSAAVGLALASLG
jgi:CrcB protein